MNDSTLLNIQQQLFHQFGFKIDVYNFESDRTIYVYRHMANMHPSNVIQVIEY